MKLKTLTCTLLSFVLLFMTMGVRAQDTHTFSLTKDNFLLDGKPFQIISGEMHPARIPRIYWRNRIQMAKAMGCNTIAVYLFWNSFEQEPGHFDFSDNCDFTEFIKICKEEHMWVLLRPGPYVCAEWDFGGLPPYLLSIPDIKVRCSDSRYLKAVNRYVDTISKRVKPLLCTNGGPIIMVQVENEYGSYGNDKNYTAWLKNTWVQDGINVPFYTADGPTKFMLEAGAVEGAAIGLDSGTSDDDFAQAGSFNPNVPAFSSETYPGWLTHWKEKWQHTSTDDIVKQVTYLLSHHRSFNLYVVHGGTNFGYTSGANAFSATQFQPDVTSYDYDAPITEQGQPTPKYFALRELIGHYVNYKIPKVPKTVKAISVAPFQVKAVTSVWQQLPEAVKEAQPVPMEALGQYHGFILYRTKLIGHKSGALTITEPHDFALVLLNGKLIDTVYRDGGKWTIKLPQTDVAEPTLDILVENMGHINFAQYMIDRKGITDRVTLNGMTLMNWDIYKLPMDELFIESLKATPDASMHDGIYYKGTFDLKEAADTYIDVSNCKKGLVWVNGHNLGRYWNTGPQKRLYCPADWLKKGENKVVIFDTRSSESSITLSGSPTLYDN
jgi:beta-galactosidase